jgi:hypothetical protein
MFPALYFVSQHDGMGDGQLPTVLLAAKNGDFAPALLTRGFCRRIFIKMNSIPNIPEMYLLCRSANMIRYQ